MRTLHALCLAAMLALAPTSAARAEGAASTQQIIAKVEQTYKDVTAIKATFSQTVSNPTLGDQTQTGTLELKRPARARWEFTAPARSALITDGSTMWVWSPDQNQVIVTQDLSAGGANELMSLLTDLSKLETFFAVEAAADAPADLHVLKLTPKRDDLKQQFTSLRLALRRDTMVLRRLEMVDSFGGKTVIELDGVELNPELPDSRFVFDVPAGATVIDSGGL